MGVSLAYGLELLILHGMRQFHKFLENLLTGQKSHGKTKVEMLRNANISQIVDHLRRKFAPAAKGAR